MVVVNDEPVLYNDDIDKDGWQNFEAGLLEGFNQISVIYRFYSYDDVADMQAFIDVLEVTGTQRASHECYECRHGYSGEGARVCTRCERDEYLVGHECLKCPSDTYSPRGTVGLDNCRPRAACSASDIVESYTTCHDGKRSRIFSWLPPVICDTANAELPGNNQDLPCETCNPGFFQKPVSAGSKDSFCAPCPDGTYHDQDDPADVCHECPAGSYAPKVLNYTTWSPLPAGFDNKCIPISGEECEKSHGWFPTGLTLMSGSEIDRDVNLVLSRMVDISEEGAYADFTYTLEDSNGWSNRLYFLVDGMTVGAYAENVSMENTGKFPLGRGTHVLTWKYHRSSTDDDSEINDNCFIHSIRIFGTSEGGASQCEECPDGTYSSAGAVTCTECPAGQTNTLDRKGCQFCASFQVKNAWQKTCHKCPDNTTANKNFTHCIGGNYIDAPNGDTFYIQELSGIVNNTEGMNAGLCEREALALYCSGTFYGGMEEEDNYYYISVLNPGMLDIQNYGYFNSSERMGYAYGIIQNSELLPNAVPSTTDNPCMSDFDKVKVNLGAHVGAVESLWGGFSITYNDGDLCNAETGEKFSTKIHFICDVHETGWPMFVNRTDCVFHFEWRSVYACKL